MAKARSNSATVNSAAEPQATMCAVEVAHTPASAADTYPSAGWLQYHSNPARVGAVALWRALVHKPHPQRAAYVQSNAVHAQLRKAGMPRSMCKQAALAVLPMLQPAQQTAEQTAAQPTTGKSKIPVLHTRAQAAHAGAVTYSGSPAALGKGNGGKHGATRAGDLPHCSAKQAVLQALLTLGATSPQRVVSAQQIATCAAASLTSAGEPAHKHTVLARHFCYHAGAAATPLVVTVTNAFGRAHGFYLTSAGQAYVNGDSAVSA